MTSPLPRVCSTTELRWHDVPHNHRQAQSPRRTTAQHRPAGPLKQAVRISRRGQPRQEYSRRPTRCIARRRERPFKLHGSWCGSPPAKGFPASGDNLNRTLTKGQTPRAHLTSRVRKQGPLPPGGRPTIGPPVGPASATTDRAPRTPAIGYDEARATQSKEQATTPDPGLPRGDPTHAAEATLRRRPV